MAWVPGWANGRSNYTVQLHSWRGPGNVEDGRHACISGLENAVTKIPGTEAGADGGTKAARHWLKIKGRARQLARCSDLLLFPAQHRRPLPKTAAKTE